MSEVVLRLLTKGEVELLYKLSLSKCMKISLQTNKMYFSLVDKLNLNDKLEFFESVYDLIMSDIDKNKKEVFEKELWNDGWMLIDPYFLACFRPIIPLVYATLYIKGVTTTQVKKEFSGIAINDAFRKISGRYVDKFISILSKEGMEYYKQLDSYGIMKKFGRDVKAINLKGISKSIVYDLLRYMRRLKKIRGDKHGK